MIKTKGLPATRAAFRTGKTRTRKPEKKIAPAEDWAGVAEKAEGTAPGAAKAEAAAVKAAGVRKPAEP